MPLQQATNTATSHQTQGDLLHKAARATKQTYIQITLPLLKTYLSTTNWPMVSATCPGSPFSSTISARTASQGSLSNLSMALQTENQCSHHNNNTAAAAAANMGIKMQPGTSRI
jgi:hypothetical protein